MVGVRRGGSSLGGRVLVALLLGGALATAGGPAGALAQGPTATVAAQEVPAGGYYANGAYYVPAPAAAPAAPNACPAGYGVPTVYVATSPTMIRIRQIWPVNEAAPGFPYVPVYASQLEC